MLCPPPFFFPLQREMHSSTSLLGKTTAEISVNGKGAVFLHPWHCGCAESSSVSSSLLVSCSLFTLGFVSCDLLAQSSKMHFNHDAAGRGRQGVTYC